MEVFGGGSNVPAGARAYWQIDVPAGLVIVGVHTEGSGMISYGVNANMGWGGGFYWQGGWRRSAPERDRVQLAAAVLQVLRVADHLRLEHV
jgi:hypothetical protein